MSDFTRFNQIPLLSTNQLFWLMQFAGWLLLAMLWYLVYTVTFQQTEVPYLLHPLVQSLLGIVISWPMRSLFHRFWEKRVAVKLMVVILAVMFFSFLWTIARLGTFIWITGESKNFLPEFNLWYFPGILVFSCWAALYHVFRYYRFLQEEHDSLLRSQDEIRIEQLKREKAERLAKEAQLKMLQYQLNPHFLFNTMNAIMSLVSSGQNSDATRMIDSLSSFLRSALDGDPMQRVTLREEIKSLKTYLEIEQARFKGRLKINYRISEQDYGFHVPGMILQPLAENVIKHAVRPTSEPVSLSISASGDDDFLEIKVHDSGPGIEHLKDGGLPVNGIGLQNVQDRLQNIYGDEHLMRLDNNKEGGLCVTIRIPALREAPDQPSSTQARTYA